MTLGFADGDPARSTCVSRVVPLPAAGAAAAFDQAAVMARAGAGRWRVAAGDHTALWLRPDVGRAEPASFGYRPLRRVRGILEGRRVRLAVEVELFPWCCHRSELVLRLATPRARLPWWCSSRRYFAAAHRVLARLDADIGSWSRVLPAVPTRPQPPLPVGDQAATPLGLPPG